MDHNGPPITRLTWGGHWPRVRELTKAIAKYRPSSGCLACHIKALNILREAVGMPRVQDEASESLRSRRLQVCRGVAEDGSDACPAYHASTDSCGRLIFDAVSSEHVTDTDGTLIAPCGCLVAVKASFKSFTCPAQKWPNR